jgi:molybdenum cofactor cytidylyltransferase
MKQGREKVACLVLAAGASTRMDQPKQLLTVRGQTLLDRSLGQALDSLLDRVVLVLGSDSRRIRRGLETNLNHPRLKVIVNKQYREGISSSIIAGLTDVENTYDHVMIILADMPGITSSIINELLHQYLASGLPLGAIKTRNRRSHPVIIGRRFYENLHHLKGDVGARDLFMTYAEQVCLVEPQEPFDHIDIDTIQDYLKFKRLAETSSNIPG